MLNKQPKKNEKHDDTVVKRSSRRQHDDDHGGAWKVAFADFCLALMCLFLVLWVMAARQQERVQEVMQSPGGHMMDEGQGIMPETLGGPRGSMIEREPMPQRAGHSTSGDSANEGGGTPSEPNLDPFAQKKSYESPSELRELAQVLSHMSSDAGLTSNLQAVVTPYGLRVMLHDTERQGMFERGSSVANERFRTLLRKMGPLFSHMENQMLVVGHTDSLQFANRSYAAFSNWTLSANRAMTARAQLLAGGMRTDSILQVVGMADRAPIDTHNATAGVNRRIELLILTRQQARNISAMFGMPGEQQPLIDGVGSSVPENEAVRALRSQLVAKKEGGPGAN